MTTGEGWLKGPRLLRPVVVERCRGEWIRRIVHRELAPCKVLSVNASVTLGSLVDCVLTDSVPDRVSDSPGDPPALREAAPRVLLASELAPTARILRRPGPWQVLRVDEIGGGRLLSLVLELATHRLPMRLARVVLQSTDLHPVLRHALTLALLRPRQITTVTALAAAAGTSRTTLWRAWQRRPAVAHPSSDLSGFLGTIGLMRSAVFSDLDPLTVALPLEVRRVCAEYGSEIYMSTASGLSFGLASWILLESGVRETGGTRGV